MFKLDPRGGYNSYSVDKNFFKTWLPQMAYVLGFLYADGNIENAVSSRTCYIKFHSSDRELIEKIRTVIGATHPVYVRKEKIHRYKNGKSYLSKKLFCLRIGSREMFDDLLKFGLKPNKSKTIQFPNVPIRYLNDFVRGYFDGDGCITFWKRPNIKDALRVIFTSGSRYFLEDLSSVLSKVLKITRHKVYVSNGAYQLKFSVRDGLKFLNYIYGRNNGLFLKRKYDIFLRYLVRYPSG